MNVSDYAISISDGWTPVWVGVNDTTEASDRVYDIDNAVVHVKLACGHERRYITVRPELEPPSYAHPMRKMTALTPGDDIGIQGGSLTAQKLCRIATVQGICPFTTPGYGIGKEILRATDLRIASLDIEQTTYYRNGRFPLPTDPLMSIGIVTNDGRRYCRYTVGRVDDVRIHELGVVDVGRCVDSTEMVDWALEWMFNHNPDFVCMHNGFGYDISRLAAHCSQKYAPYFINVNLGKTAKGYDLCIPGVTVVDTWWFLQKLHGADYASTSLAALAKHYGISDKMKSPSMAVNMNDDTYDYTEMALYNVHDAYITLRVAELSKCIDEIIALSVITKSPLSDASRFISGTLMTNLSATHAINMGVVMDWSPEPTSTGRYKGATVLRPIQGMHSMVHVVDFKSLYPNIMVSANISTETIQLLDCTDEDVQTMVLTPLHLWYDDALDWTDTHVLMRSNDIVTVIDKRVKSVHSTSLEYLISERARIKSENGGKDTPLSYAEKISSNSLYGAMGASTGYLSSRYAAAAVTGIGRYLLALAVTVAKLIGAVPLYGDTDSLFFTASVTSRNRVNIIGREHSLPQVFMVIFHNILKYTPFTTIRFEHEKTYVRLMLVTQKNYVGVYEKFDKASGCVKRIYEMKGVAAKRRDRIKLARDVSNDVAHILCNNPTDRTLRPLAEYLLNIFARIDNGDITLEDASLERKEDGIQYYVFMSPDGTAMKVPIEYADPNRRYDVNRTHVAECVKRALAPIFAACDLPSLEQLLRWYMTVHMSINV